MVAKKKESKRPAVASTWAGRSSGNKPAKTIPAAAAHETRRVAKQREIEKKQGTWAGRSSGNKPAKTIPAAAAHETRRVAKQREIEKKQGTWAGRSSGNKGRRKRS